MKRLGHLFAILAFAVSLLLSAAGGAVTQNAADHRPAHCPPAHAAPAPDGAHKATAAVAAPCCAAAEVPPRRAVPVTVKMIRVSWSSPPESAPDARSVPPEPHPPKAAV